MAELTKLTGTYIRSGSIPTTALSGGVVSSSLQIISALPTGSVSSSAQVAELLPVGTVSSSTQVDYTVLSNVPAGIASSSAQVTAYLPTDTVSSSGQVTSFLPTNTVSSSGQVTAFLPTGTVSQSSQVDITGTTNYTSFSSSLATVDTAQTNRLTTLESVTGSYATTGSNTFVAPQTISDTTNSTSYLDGALHVAGGMSVRQDVRISGSMTINGLLTAVSMSTQYVTSSQYNVGVSRITLNDDDNVRFAGLSIIDSGSASPASASIFWDSLQHRFIYENLSGSSYNSSIIIAGPKHTGSIGDEPTLTSGYLPYATGTDHIDNSVMFQSSSRIGIGTTNPTVNLDIENGSGWAGLDLNGTSGGEIRLQKNGTTYGQLYASEGGSTGFVINAAGAGNDIYFQNAGTTTMTILDSGNVGIGSTIPESMLTVAGTLTLKSSGEGGPYIYRDGNNAGDIRFYATNGTFASPTAKTNGSYLGQFHWHGYDGSSYIETAAIYAVVDGAVSVGTLPSRLDFYTGTTTATHAMVIKSNGNVGIGTTDPAGYRLNVIGGATRVASYLSFGDNGYIRGDSSGWLQLQGGSTGTRIMESSNTAARVTVLDGGNVGIGTTNPRNALHVASAATIDTVGADNKWTLRLHDTTSAAVNVGGGVLFQGYKTSTSAIGNFGAIAGLKENSTSGNENGYLVFFTTPNATGLLTERMRIDSSGNVGINTSTPQTALHLIGNMTMGDTTYSRPALKSTYWGYSASYRVLMVGSSSTSYSTQHTGAVTVAFNYDPSANANGSFNGDGREIIFRRGTQFVTPNSADTSFNLYNLVLLDGNVGINTATPGYNLDVNGSIRIDGNGSRLYLRNGFTAEILNPNNNTRDIQFNQNTNGTVFFKGDGSVGIGTTNPLSRLHVNVGADGEIARFNGASGNLLYIGTDGTGTYIENAGSSTARRTLRLQTSNGSGTYTQFLIKDGSYEFAGGNVGIGTTNPSSTSRLHIAGSTQDNITIFYTGTSGGHESGIRFEDFRGQQNAFIGNNLDNDGVGVAAAHMVFKTTTGGTLSERMRITTGGNVGIGTVNPGSYKLQVQGDTYVTGTLTEGSSIALKKNINPITDALNIINNLTGYTFDRTDSDATNQAGLIAEEVAEVLPGVVSRDQEGNPSGVQYTKIIAYLVESIKELKSELDELKRQ